MAKKGTCTNCGRQNMALVAGGHCGLCYRARRGLKGAPREAALLSAKQKASGSRQAQPVAAESGATERSVPGPEGPLWLKPTPEYRNQDDRIRDAVVKLAAARRRSAWNQVMVLLEDALVAAGYLERRVR